MPVKTATEKSQQAFDQDLSPEILATAQRQGLTNLVNEVLEARGSPDKEVRTEAREFARGVTRLNEAGMAAVPSLAHKARYNMDYISTGIVVFETAAAVGGAFALYEFGIKPLYNFVKGSF